MVALGAAMLLAGDGHEVIMLERDPDRPPGQHGRRVGSLAAART